MTANQLIQYLSWAVYLLIFVSTGVAALRRPRRTNVDIALLFSDATGIIAVSVVSALLFPAPAWLGAISGALLLALGYLLLRVIDDFATAPAWLMRAAAGALVGLVLGLFVLPPPAPGWFNLLALAYLIALPLYAVLAFGREARQARGVTRRRMRAAAAGSVALCAIFVLTGLGIVFPGQRGLWTPLTALAGLASAVAFYIGFAPPGLLRRAWQEPELRAFLGQAAVLSRLPNQPAILGELERGAARAIGAPHAAIGLWDADAGVMRYTVDGTSVERIPVPEHPAGRAFLLQRPAFTADLGRDLPALADASRAAGARALLAAPITVGDKRLGVLTVYAPQAPIFAEEDLDLLTLLADQAAVVLESRALSDETARMRAREEVTRLKEDFLSAAAHDLKTPLTTIVAQAQLLERKAQLAPDAPADLASIQRLVKSGQRMRSLVLQLLDSTRAEHGQLLSERVPVDLAALAVDACAQHDSPAHPCRAEVGGPVSGLYDALRMQQLLDNLIENATKYSPDGGPVEVAVWPTAGWNHLRVTDHGIGIPSADLPFIFDRFHRATNVASRQLAGMGLGLFICRGIVEQHGGRITVTSSPEQGSSFHVELPA